MNYNSNPASEDEPAHSFPSSPPPSHIFFPPTIFSPLMFPTNSPLASPLSPGQLPLRSNINPFDQPISSPFEQRSNLFDTYTHDRSTTPPPTQRPPSPEHANIHTGLHNLDIDMPATEPLNPVLPTNQKVEAVGEWPTDYPSPESADDICFEDEGLSPLERIYLFSQSKGVFHRVYIAHALTTFLPQITPQDAVDYVIPLLSGLAMDDDEAVKEALSAELVSIIWWFITHCKVVVEEEASSGMSSNFSTSSAATLLSVQTFTPILGTLLLSPNPMVGGSARGAVVELLRRIKLSDDREDGVVRTPMPENVGQTSSFSTSDDTWTREKGGEEWPIGLFHQNERKLLENELFYQVVIGMGKLDISDEDLDDGLTPGVVEQHRRKSPLLTPNRPQPLEHGDSYFPASVVIPPHSDSPSPPDSIEAESSISQPTTIPEDIDDSPRSQGSTPTLSPTGSDPSPVDTSSPNSSKESSPVSIEMIVSHVQSDEPNEEAWRRTPDRNNNLLLPSSAGQDSDIKEEDRGEWVEYGEGDNFQGGGYDGGEALDQPGDCDDSEQAAVGRLSSMSLMAAVAASGSLADEMKAAFVKEVQRVGQDPVFWVRREASYALGALAKVVPVEIVEACLLPLLKSLCQDTVWHVRHSALFALPAILSRLPFKQRKALALNTLLPLAEDTSSSVRIGVLEAIGEVVYTFHDDDGAVPEELLELFVGRRDMGSKANEPHDARTQPPRDDWPEYDTWTSNSNSTNDGESRDIWNDPSRPLICAFNYPAVALTLGRNRWPELRNLYRELAQDESVKVRRTLAASLGELAKIIGVDNARADLMDVFKASIKAEEGDVRAKTVEALQTFVTAISDENRWEVVELLNEAWKGKQLKGWREREGVVKLLGVLVALETDPWLSLKKQTHRVQKLKAMLMRGLQDDVACVRDAAVQVMPAFSKAWKSRRPTALNELIGDVQNMAVDLKYTRRMTFVACQQQLVLADENVQTMVRDPAFRHSLERLASDKIVGVRIGVARLLGELGDKYHRNEQQKPDWILHLIQRLAEDSSADVRSFVASAVQPSVRNKPTRPMVHRYSSSELPLPATFSRPPRPVGIGTEPEPIATSPTSMMDRADELQPRSKVGDDFRSDASTSSSVNSGGSTQLHSPRTTDQPVAMSHSSLHRPHLVPSESELLRTLS